MYLRLIRSDADQFLRFSLENAIPFQSCGGTSK